MAFILVALALTALAIPLMGLHLYTYHMWTTGQLKIDWVNNLLYADPAQRGWSDKVHVEMFMRQMNLPGGPPCLVSHLTPRAVWGHIAIICLVPIALIITKGAVAPITIIGAGICAVLMLWMYLMTEIRDRNLRASTQLHTMACIAIYVVLWCSGLFTATLFLMNS